jgi:hypothetical protein
MKKLLVNYPYNLTEKDREILDQRLMFFAGSIGNKAKDCLIEEYKEKLGNKIIVGVMFFKDSVNPYVLFDKDISSGDMASATIFKGYNKFCNKQIGV